MLPSVAEAGRFCYTRQVNGLDHVEVLTGDGNLVAALVGGFLGLDHGGVANNQLLRGVHAVGNGVFVLDLVDITHNDGARYRVGRDFDLEFVAGLAHELGHDHIAAEDDFLDGVEVFAGDGDLVAREGLSGAEGLDHDRLGVLQVEAGGGFDAGFGDDGHRAHFGAFDRDHHADLAARTGGDGRDVGDGHVAGEAHLGDGLQVAADDAELTAAHHRVGGDGGQGDRAGVLVGIQLVLNAAGQRSERQDGHGEQGMFEYIFHFPVSFDYLMGTARMLSILMTG